LQLRRCLVKPRQDAVNVRVGELADIYAFHQRAALLIASRTV
jgi:hypothetical protein